MMAQTETQRRGGGNGLAPLKLVKPSRPTAIEPQLETIPAELRGLAQWVMWRYERDRNGKWTKVPYNVETGHRASSTDPKTWVPFNRVAEAYRRGGYDGIGFVFTPDDPYCGADFDKCFDDVEGEKVLNPDAARWVERFDSYCEYSISGKGLHVIMKAKPDAGFNNKGAGRELYSTGRFFTFTGASYHDQPKPIAERSDVAEAFISEYAPKRDGTPKPTPPPQRAKKKSTGADKWRASGRAPLLTLEAITYDASNPLEVFKAKLGVRLSEDVTATVNSSGKVDCCGYCHAGEGTTGLFFDPKKNTVTCNDRCDLKRIAAAFDMSLTPEGDNQYRVTPSGIIWLKTIIEPIPLCNFTASITGEIIRDDGTEQTDVYEITATMNGAAKVGSVAAGEFAALRWVNEILGATARIYPNRERYVVDAVRALSNDINRRIVIAHTGWRQDDDGWRYYHAGGAISSSGLIEAEISLPPQLENFILVAPPDDAQLKKDFQVMWENLIDVTPDRPDVMVAGVGEVLCSVFTKPDFSGFDFGTTGTRKTQVQALKQSFFGSKFTAVNLVESWKSSQYALETLTSKAKDAAICIDEFKPEGTGGGRDKWHEKADYVLRGVANRQGRSTLRADRTERPARNPQGMVFCSGEELPNGESLRARLSIKEFDEKTVDIERLTVAQKLAADGVYVRVMSAFIQWLATDGRIEKLRAQRDEEIMMRRAQWIANLGMNSHGRTADNNAHLEWGWETFLSFIVARGVMDDSEKSKCLGFVISTLDTHACNQARYLNTANDALKFIELIQDAFISGKAHLTDPQGEKPETPEAWGWKSVGMGEHQAQGICIGVIDGAEIYLLPDASYKLALEAGAGTDRLRLTQNALQKRLREEGLLARTTEGRDSRNTIKATIKGKRSNVLCFRAATFGAETPHPQPESLTEIVGVGGENRDSVRSVPISFSDCPDFQKLSGHYC